MDENLSEAGTSTLLIANRNQDIHASNFSINFEKFHNLTWIDPPSPEFGKQGFQTSCKNNLKIEVKIISF